MTKGKMIRLKIDKTAFSVGSLNDEPDEKRYWYSKLPAERLQALEMMRQIIYGYVPASTRLQRFFEIVKITKR